MDNIPQSELDEMVAYMYSHPEYLDTEYVINTYRAYGLEVIPDPFSADICAPIKHALQAKLGYSAIRIGDGEGNIITFGVYPNTPQLDRFVVQKIMSKHLGAFVNNDYWMIILRDLLVGAIAYADMIGVEGLWRANNYERSVESDVQKFLKHDRDISESYRGISGYWRAIAYMLSIARNEEFRRKLIASKSLYFSVLEHLDDLLPAASKIYVLSSRDNILDGLRRKYPNLNFEFIYVGNGLKETQRTLLEGQFYLPAVYAALPSDLRGCLCLVGAGPWAEVYCTWVKQRGGVGVDIGSGCDLLAGLITRPVHKRLGLDLNSKYKL